MNNKKAKEIRRKLIAKNGGKPVRPGVIRDAKRTYTRQGNVLSQRPKLVSTKRQARMEFTAVLEELNKL